MKTTQENIMPMVFIFSMRKSPLGFQYEGLHITVPKPSLEVTVIIKIVQLNDNLLMSGCSIFSFTITVYWKSLQLFHCLSSFSLKNKPTNFFINISVHYFVSLHYFGASQTFLYITIFCTEKRKWNIHCAERKWITER